ncbi:MAG TPA: methionine--tRNA ligase subunit beta, partial [Candidatus Kapabacteria bacterium]|nr:methionine--tRNA ligase subunit beta [Candidatus Kapabacteria bacterium]
TTQWITFLGKDNIVFHTIMFPAMLLAHNESEKDRQFILPANVPANEWLNLEGQKLSKSRGWVVELHEILDRYPTDIIRYAFATMLPEQKDSDFLWKEFQARANNELADIFGNFANRVLTFAKRNFENKIMGNRNELDAEGKALLDSFGEGARKIAGYYERFRLRDATSATMDLARSANKYFNDAEPWRIIKEDKEQAAKVIRSCLEALRALAIYFAPITPVASQNILNTLGHSFGEENWSNAHEPKLHGQIELGEVTILFPKIEDEMIQGEQVKLFRMADDVNRKNAAKEALHATRPDQVKSDPNLALSTQHSALISIDDFKKIKLRTAKILEAERVPKSKKLIKLQIEVGEEQRQIIAGIGQKYTPEELVGKTIVVVANLQPAKLMGQESNGMLLAVNDENGVVALVAPETEAAPGLEVR